MDSFNKNKKIIKVCKVDDFAFAKYAIHSGAAYLGVHILEEKQIGKHSDLVEYIKKANGKVIIVTKVREYSCLKKIIEHYQPHGLQLHFSPDLDLLSLLKNNYPTSMLFPIITRSTNVELIEKLILYSEKIIYDTSFIGGTGTRNDLALLGKMSNLTLGKILLAGGVNLDAVKKSMDADVAGYDIQSFFRDGNSKFFNRLESVFRELGYAKYSRLSVSLTDVPLADIDRVVLYQSQPQTNFHLDYSDGSLYENFITDRIETIGKSMRLNKYPHAVHIFQNSIELINKTIQEFTNKNPYSITGFFIQYFPEIDMDRLSGSTNITVSIYYKDIQEYIQKYKGKFRYLSIILPSDNLDKSHEVIRYINQHADVLKGVEIWFDRELTVERIRMIKEKSVLPFNVIVGKEITENWSNLPLIYEQISV